MKKNICLILLCVAFIQSNAQSSFQKYYFTSSTDKNADIFVLSDSSYIITRQAISSGRKNLQLIKVNTNGDTVWTRSGYNSYITDYLTAKLTVGDNLYIGGFVDDSLSDKRSGALMKTDAAGNVLWSKIYNDTTIQTLSFVNILNNGNLLLLGAAYRSATPQFGLDFIAKADTLGNIIWMKYGAFSGNINNYGIELPDHGFAITAHYFTNLTNAICTRYDSLGNRLWIRSMPGGAIKYNPITLVDTILVATYFSTNFYPASTVHCDKYDLAGNTISTSRYTFQDLNEVNEILPTNDFGYIISGRFITDYENSDAIYYKVDSAFNIQWQQLIDSFPLENGTCAIQTAAGGYLLMANVNSFRSDTNGFSITILDSLGNLITTSERQITNHSFCNVYPNPFATTATIQINNPQGERYDISICNLMGENVFSSSFSNSVYLINRNQLKSGIYFFRIRSQSGKQHSGKLILE